MIGSVVAGFSHEIAGQFLRPSAEAPPPTDLEELEDEVHRWKLKVRALEEETILPPRRLIYFGLAVFGGLLVYLWLVKK